MAVRGTVAESRIKKVETGAFVKTCRHKAEKVIICLSFSQYPDLEWETSSQMNHQRCCDGGVAGSSVGTHQP